MLVVVEVIPNTSFHAVTCKSTSQVILSFDATTVQEQKHHPVPGRADGKSFHSSIKSYIHCIVTVYKLTTTMLPRRVLRKAKD